MAAGSTEIHFAKKLANNEKKTRDKALRKLRAWLASRPQNGPGFKEIDLLRLWKGLFYCMWMSDKPLIQEELAENISQLMHSLKNLESAVLFIKTFFKTMSREWHGIDRLRIDKFYLLIRLFINNTFVLTKNNAWDDSLVMFLRDVYANGPLSPNSINEPDGIKLHLCLVYFPELKTVIGGESLPEVVLKLLDPLLVLAAQTKSKIISNAVRENVLEFLVKQRETELSVGKDDDGDNDGDVDGDEVEDELYHSLKIDYSGLVERLLALASSRDILGRNRNQLYQYVKRLRRLSTDTPVIEERKVTNTNQPAELSNAMEKDENIHKKTLEIEVLKKKSIKKIKKKKRRLEDNDDVSTKRHKCQTEENNGEQLITKIQQSEVVEHVKMGKKKKKKRKRTTASSEMLRNSNSCEINKNASISVKHGKEECVSTENEIGLVTNNKSVSKKGNKIISKKKRHKISKEQHVDTLMESSVFKNGVDLSDASLNGLMPTENDLKKSCSSLEVAPKKFQATKEYVVTEEKPFAFFQKTKVTPPSFLRKAVSKAASKTEPRKHKVHGVPGATPKSDPAGLAKKRVRIALSNNTAQTTHDYRKSLTDSPHVPFDADRTPKQSLLKDATISTRISRFAIRKRPSAADFF